MDVSGSLRITPENGGPPTVVADAASGKLTLGGGGRSGKFEAEDADGRLRLEYDSFVGGGRLRMNDEQGRKVVELVATFGGALIDLGCPGIHGGLIARNVAGDMAVRIIGRDGDIELGGADAAEDWQLGDGLDDAAPGSVMAIDPDGRLILSSSEYDPHVAGVVSGAGGFRRGILLGRTEGSTRTVPIALAGRVGCLVDADASPVRAGDLLTTSALPGHAMRATDPGRAFGSVLGKALAPLSAGRGIVPTLVSLH